MAELDVSEHVVASVLKTGEDVIVVLRGEIDLETSKEVERCLVDCRESGCSWVTVDMASVTFFDLSGLRALLSPMGEVVVRDPSPLVRKVLELTDMAYLMDSVRARN
jgi:anti-anti-sigma factor